MTGTATVYQCPECDERMPDRRCGDCNPFTRRLGPGGPCPSCDEMILAAELTENDQPPAPTYTETLTSSHRIVQVPPGCPGRRQLGAGQLPAGRPSTRPGSCPERRRRSPCRASDNAPVNPTRSASSDNNTVPACDTTPAASAVTTGNVLLVVACTGEVPLPLDDPEP